jgi:hypothetical protein
MTSILRLYRVRVLYLPRSLDCNFIPQTTFHNTLTSMRHILEYMLNRQWKSLYNQEQLHSIFADISTYNLQLAYS